MHFVICSLKYAFRYQGSLRSEIVEYTGPIWYIVHSKCQTIFVQQFDLHYIGDIKAFQTTCDLQKGIRQL